MLHAVVGGGVIHKLVVLFCIKVCLKVQYMLLSALQSFDKTLGSALTDIPMETSTSLVSEAHRHAAIARKNKWRVTHTGIRRKKVNQSMKEAVQWLDSMNEVCISGPIITPKNPNLWTLVLLDCNLTGHIRLVSDTRLEITVLGSCSMAQEVCRHFVNIYPNITNLQELQTALNATGWGVSYGDDVKSDGEDTAFHVSPDKEPPVAIYLYSSTKDNAIRDRSNVTQRSIGCSVYSETVKAMQKWILESGFANLILHKNGAHWTVIFESGTYQIIGALVFDVNRCNMAWFWAVPIAGDNAEEGFKENLRGFDDVNSFKAFFENTRWDDPRSMEISYDPL